MTQTEMHRLCYAHSSYGLIKVCQGNISTEFGQQTTKVTKVKKSSGSEINDFFGSFIIVLFRTKLKDGFVVVHYLCVSLEIA